MLITEFPSELKSRFGAWIGNVSKLGKRRLTIEFPDGFRWVVYNRNYTKRVIDYKMADPGETLNKTQLEQHKRVLEEMYRLLQKS